jgi:hypothetical protein
VCFVFKLVVEKVILIVVLDWKCKLFVWFLFTFDILVFVCSVFFVEC